MKIHCECGYSIIDQTDGNTSKASILPDETLFTMLDAIDAAIETGGSSPKEREATCMKVRALHTKFTRHVWQCSNCWRLYVDMPDRSLQCFKPNDEGTTYGVLAASVPNLSK